MQRELKLLPQYVHRPQQMNRWRTRLFKRFQDHLRRQGLKLTRQRQAIVDFLVHARDHVGMEEIYESMKRKSMGIGRSTVFRTLKLLEASGLASRITGKDEIGRYEINYERPHHDHLICVVCGGITEFESPQMERHQDASVRRLGFRMLWHRHEIYGRCRKCQSK